MAVCDDYAVLLLIVLVLIGSFGICFIVGLWLWASCYTVFR